MGDVLVVAGDVVGMDGVDDVADVVGLHRHRRVGVQHDLGPAAGLPVQHVGLQVLPGPEIIQGRAVAQHSGDVHGHAVHQTLEGGQGPAGGHGEGAAVSHEVVQSLQRPGGGRGHVHSAPEGGGGVHDGIVKVAGQQYTGEFSHSCLSLF